LSKDFDSQLAQRIALEALLIRISQVSVEVSLDAVLDKLLILGSGGTRSVAATPAPAPKPPVPAPAAEPAPAPARAAEPPAGPAPIALTPENLREQWSDLLGDAAGDLALN